MASNDEMFAIATYTANKVSTALIGQNNKVIFGGILAIGVLGYFLFRKENEEYLDKKIDWFQQQGPDAERINQLVEDIVKSVIKEKMDGKEVSMERIHQIIDEIEKDTKE